MCFRILRSIYQTRTSLLYQRLKVEICFCVTAWPRSCIDGLVNIYSKIRLRGIARCLSQLSNVSMLLPTRYTAWVGPITALGSPWTLCHFEFGRCTSGHREVL